jgi:hypothetical protein
MSHRRAGFTLFEHPVICEHLRGRSGVADFRTHPVGTRFALALCHETSCGFNTGGTQRSEPFRWSTIAISTAPSWLRSVRDDQMDDRPVYRMETVRFVPIVTGAATTPDL